MTPSQFEAPYKEDENEVENRRLLMTPGLLETTLKCPRCQAEIQLTESLAAPLLEKARREFDERLARKDIEMGALEQALRNQEAALSRARGSLDAELAIRLSEATVTIARDEAQKARLLHADDLRQKEENLQELREALDEQNRKLADSQREQAAVQRKVRELDDARRELELSVEARVQKSLHDVRRRAIKDAEDGTKLQVAERDELIRQMRRQIEDLKQKAEHGSEQLQGEVQELALEALLRGRFPEDDVVPVGKGQRGGDLCQHVAGIGGQVCGAILWESKRTRRWSDAWLTKLRDDQRNAKAQASILVSRVLPPGIVAFDLREGVWVTDFRCALPVATVLRQTLIELAAARRAGEGQQTKMDQIYRYLTGPRFRERMHAIVEKFVSMREDLELERRALTRAWAKREEQIRSVIDTTAGLYGDLQGIAGKSLQEIDGLELPLLPAAGSEIDSSGRDPA